VVDAAGPCRLPGWESSGCGSIALFMLPYIYYDFYHRYFPPPPSGFGELGACITVSDQVRHFSAGNLTSTKKIC
jgi:hypothetical protein